MKKKHLCSTPCNINCWVLFTSTSLVVDGRLVYLLNLSGYVNFYFVVHVISASACALKLPKSCIQ